MEALASVSKSEQELIALLYGFDGQKRTPDSLLSEELHRKGALEWNGATGRALLERVAHRIDRGETGWVAPAELRRLCERLRDQP
jgi:hypothetical protein